MKFYLYVSKPKVEMLLSQICNRRKAKLSREVNINAKLFNLKQKTEYDPKELFARTLAVSQYIHAHENVGTISKPDSYIFDELNMYIIPLEPPLTNIVAVSGKTDDSVIILGASKKHFIGYSSKSYGENWTSMHFILIFAEYLGAAEWTDAMSKRAKKESPYGRNFFSHCVEFLRFHEERHTPYQNLEFLAKTLTVGIDNDSGKKVIIATPVYIAGN